MRPISYKNYLNLATGNIMLVFIIILPILYFLNSKLMKNGFNNSCNNICGGSNRLPRIDSFSNTRLNLSKSMKRFYHASKTKMI